MSRLDELLRDLAREVEPAEAELDRLEAAVLARAGRRSRRPRPLWLAGALAFAAVTVGVLLWRADPLVEPATHRTELGTGTSTVASGVVVDADGAGHAETVDGATIVAWETGRIEVEVDPTVGADVAVRTEEATVRVTGTVFAVDRDGFGTRVEVSRGRVEVRCVGEELLHVLEAGGDLRCLRDADAGLGWVVALGARGASDGEQLDAIRRARAHPSGTERAHAALRIRELGTLARLGEVDRVLEEVGGLAPPERQQVLATAAGHALDAGGCPEAEPWLEALHDAGDVVGSLLFAECLAGSDPDRARAVLEALAGWELTAAQRRSVEALRRRLP